MNDAPANIGATAVFAAAAASWLPQVRDIASILASIGALVVAYYTVQHIRSHKKKP